MVVERFHNRIRRRISDDLDWSQPTPLEMNEVILLARRLDRTKDPRDTFIRADLIFQVINEQGDINYCAAEVAWHAEQKDVDRARHYAELLEPASGIATQAAVCGESHEPNLDWNQVLWVPYKI